MEKDILAHKEAQTTQAYNTDSTTALAGAMPTVESPLADVTLAASSGVNAGQQSMGQGENDAKEKMYVLRLSPSAEADAVWPCVTPAHVALQGADSKRSIGKQYSHARKNAEKSMRGNLPQSLMVQTRASPSALILNQTCVAGALPVAHLGVGVVPENREQMQNSEEKLVSVLTKPCKVPADALLPAASPVQLSPEGDSQVNNGEIKVGKKSSYKGRKQKKKKIVVSPWPLTVQAWGSFTSPAQVAMPFAGALSSNIDEVNGEYGNRGQKGETNQRSLVTSYQSLQAGAPGLAVALGQASLLEAPLAADRGINVGKKNRWKRKNRKENSDLAHPWPLTVQAWASFTTTGPVQTVFQGQSAVGNMAVNVGQNSWPHMEMNDEVAKSILSCPVRVQAGAPFVATPLGQVSFEEALGLGDTYFNMSQPRRPEWGAEEQVVAYCQDWRHPETYVGHQDFSGYTMMNFARQADCFYLEEICLQERMQALTMNQAQTHINTSVMGMQRPERERAESQRVWMGPSGGF